MRKKQAFMVVLIWLMLASLPGQLMAQTSLQHKGLIEIVPAGGGAGEWIIGGKTFQATSSTVFDTEKGPLTVGTCAEVEYHISAEQNVAEKIASKSADDCADISNQEVHGTLEAKPTDGLTGPWTVDGVTYQASTTTIFEQTDGPFVIGGCVEVEFVVQNEQNIALRIETDDSCGNEAIQEARGILTSFPTDLIGTWTVAGINYEATASTQFRTEHGAFAAGMCVEVEYILDGSTHLAHEIQTESPDNCAAPGQGGEFEEAGLIQAMPAEGLLGTWDIGGALYEANTQTQFSQEHGAFEVGQCAEVEYRLEGETRIATQIETKRQHDCSSPDEEHEAYGLVEVLPDDGTIGVWTIGGLQYVVNPTTLLENGPFFIGLLVEVHFTRDNTGTLIAGRIEGKQNIDEEDIALAEAYGRVNAMPSGGSLGLWTVGGVDYQATADTQFEQDDGSFAIGVCAKVRYQVEGGTNIAAEIETETDADCPSDNGTPVNRAYGFVEHMPSNGFIGTWIIGDLTYAVNAATQFEEEHGLLMQGAFVKVEYVVNNGLKVAREIETHVPPKAGDTNLLGELQTNTNQLQATAVTTQTWTVNGQAFMVIEATRLDDSVADLVSGQPVYVNAYQQTGGLVATQVTALEAINTVYLPLVTR